MDDRFGAKGRGDGNEVGCSHCWVEADQKVTCGVLSFEESLFRENRFAVVLRYCPSCQQRFALVHCTLSQFGRDQDDSATLTIPVAPVEVEALRSAGTSTESQVEAIVRDLSPRKYAVTTGGPMWLANGAIVIPPHD